MVRLFLIHPCQCAVYILDAQLVELTTLSLEIINKITQVFAASVLLGLGYCRGYLQ